jgi:hypothetical protein
MPNFPNSCKNKLKYVQVSQFSQICAKTEVCLGLPIFPNLVVLPQFCVPKIFVAASSVPDPIKPKRAERETTDESNNQGQNIASSREFN